jgi:hypothetical protein
VGIKEGFKTIHMPRQKPLLPPISSSLTFTGNILKVKPVKAFLKFVMSHRLLEFGWRHNSQAVTHTYISLIESQKCHKKPLSTHQAMNLNPYEQLRYFTVFTVAHLHRELKGYRS